MIRQKHRKLKEGITAVVFGIATLCATFWFLIPQGRYFAEAMKTSEWKIATGSIVDREEYDEVYERNRKVRKVRLHYEYQVHGQLTAPRVFFRRRPNQDRRRWALPRWREGHRILQSS